MPRIIVLSLCRDVVDRLNSFYEFHSANCDALGYEVFFVFGENGSVDGTRHAIFELERSFDNVLFVDTSCMALEPERLKRMAIGRELLKARLPKEEDGDLILVADVDLDYCSHCPNVFGKFVGELFENTCFGVSCFSKPFYYDLLSLRVTHDCWNLADFQYLLRRISSGNLILRVILLPFRFLVRICVGIYQRLIKSGSKRTVLSSFNGACLYSRYNYELGSYFSNQIQCEHIALNRSIRERTGEKILISCNFGVHAPKEHIGGPIAWLYTAYCRIIRKW